MNISANIIRFPTTPALSGRAVEARAKADNVVDFPAARTDEGPSNGAAQAHGQLFAAERIIARIADQLDGVPVL